MNRKAWNKGLTKETDLRVAKYAKKMIGDRNPMKRPEVRAKHSVIMKAVSMRPEVKAKRSASQKLIQKEIHNRPEVRAKWSVGSKGENNNMFGIHRFGESAPNWRGGLSSLLYPIDFDEKLKESIRERDNNTCQLCSKTKEDMGRNLCVHHIDYNKKNLNLDNLITLCRGCNAKVNAKRDFWENYFTSKREIYA